MRTLYDSITAAHIPADATMVAGYVDGSYKWSDADWARFPNAVKVRIAVLPTTNAGEVLDIEPGNAPPDQAPAWVQMRRVAGAAPSIYVGINEWDAVRAAFRAASVPEPRYWVASWDNDPAPIAGAVAKQYANPTLTGHHYDVSSVADFWPGVDMTIPTRIAQSADLQLKPGELGQLAAIFSYPPDHPAGRTVLVKVRGDRPGRRVIAVYPPTDVDADATMLIDAEPALFIVDILPDTLPQP